MMKKLLTFLILDLLLLVLAASAQTSKNGRIMVGALADRPAACSKADQYNTNDGNGAFVCNPVDNSWVPLSSIGTYTVATLPGSPKLNDLAVVTDGNPGCTAPGGSTRALCQWNGGSWSTLSGAGGGGSPGGANLTGQCNDTGVFSDCANKTVNQKGDQNYFAANPYLSARAYGVRALNALATPAIPGCTATISSGTNTATLSSACGLQNGDGVTILTAGINNPISTPAAPAVIPAGPLGPTGVYLSAASQTGATAYDYCVAWWHHSAAPGKAVTACSTVTHITNGQATLGPVAGGVAISSITCSNATCTVTTSGNQALAAGNSFLISGAAPASFNGYRRVLAWTNATTFTYTTDADTRGDGVTTATTPGTLYYVLSNNIGSAAPPTGSANGDIGIVYRSGPGGGGAIACLYLPQRSSMSADRSYLNCDDYGSTYSPAFNLPYGIPTTAPAAATNEALTTTITSGGGTTNITLAANASNNAPTQTILFDDAPTLSAALTASTSMGGTGSPVRLDYGRGTGNSWVINSLLSVPNGASIEYNGGLVANDTIQLNQSALIGVIGPNCGVGQFAISCLPVISPNRAWPAIIINSTGSTIKNISMNGIQDGAIGILGIACGITTTTVSNIQMTLLGSGYTNIGLFTMAGSGEACTIFGDNVAWTGGQIGVGLMYTPAMAVNTIYFNRLSGSGKGVLIKSATESAIQDFFYVQAPYQPALSAFNPLSGTSPLSILLGGGEDDTGVTKSWVTNWGGVAGGVNLKIITKGLQTQATGGVNNVTTSGSGSTSIFEANGPTGLVTQTNGYETGPAITSVLDGIYGQTTGSVYIKTLLASLKLGAGNAFFISNYTPPAPTCPVSAGGSVPIGSYTITFTPIMETGGEGSVSLSCSATTTGGNQTITVSWTAIVGAKGYNVYFNNNRSNASPVTTNTYVLSTNTFQGIGYTAPADGTVGGQNGLLHSQTYALGRSTFSKISDSFESKVAVPDGSGGLDVVGALRPTASDDCNRTNGAIGSNWTVLVGGVNCTTNRIVGTAGTANTALWSGWPITGGAQFSQAVVHSVAGGSFYGVAIGADLTHYYDCQETPSTLTFQQNGSGNLATTPVTVAADDIIRLEFDPTKNPNFVCTSTNASTGVVTSTSSNVASPFSSMVPGIFPYNTGGTLDNWTGGYLHPSARIDVENDFSADQRFRGAVVVGLPTPSNAALTSGTIYTLGLQFAAGNSITSVSGNSGRAAQSTGTLTSGNLASYDANGNLVDSTIVATNVMQKSVMTTLGDTLYEDATPTPTRLAGPTATNGVPQVLTSTPSSGLATAPVWSVGGVPVNPQVGTSYTILATDRLSYLSFSNAGAIAVTLPQAGTTGFASNFAFVACAIGAGTATITPTTSTISYTTGSAYTAAAASMALTTGQCAWIYSDNANYFAIRR